MRDLNWTGLNRSLSLKRMKSRRLVRRKSSGSNSLSKNNLFKRMKSKSSISRLKKSLKW